MKKKERALDWFGADVVDTPASKTTEVEYHGFKGVDTEEKPAPKYLRAKTTAGERTPHEVAQATARFKMAREGFRFAPNADKETWEKRRDIAYAEMQIVRFQHKLASYESRPNPRPEQVKLLKDTINRYRGEWMELTGQG